jgi:ABC-2 type transport system ATP-binding protein
MTPAVELRALTKSFANVRAVDGLDLTITPGEIVAVLGPNGAGKSTTTELILGLIRPDAGQVRVFGMEPTAAVGAGRVGAMLQAGALLYGATVGEVLRLMRGLHLHPLPLAEVIERAQLGSFLRTRTQKLSGGQAQRLRYALAILPDPDLLILDEPTVAMDVELRRGFWVSMRDFIAGGRTVLFATHYLDEADTEANRIVVLNDGRLAADGRADQIKDRVAGRVITLAGDRLDPAAVGGLAGVGKVEALGARLHLHSTDSDATLRALLTAFPSAHDIEVTPTRLEDAFLALTATEV